jgi:hypothetical protein
VHQNEYRPQEPQGSERLGVREGSAEFNIEYPMSLSEQKKITQGFEERSDVSFSNCAGCIVGLMTWTHKLTEKDADKSGVGIKKFLCGLKGKFGLNCQAISDVCGRIHQK